MRNCSAAARYGGTGIGTPWSAFGSGNGARYRKHHYRVGAGAFQGAGARFHRRSGGVYIVDQEDRRRNRAALRHAESPLDIFVPMGSGKTCLGDPVPGSRKRQRVEREADAARKAGSDQRGEVEPPTKIFPGVDRYRDHGGRSPVRDQVSPSADEGLVDAPGHNVDRVGAARVFRRHDRGANVPCVGEEGARGVERGRGGGADAAGRRMRTGSGAFECAAPGAYGEVVRGPAGDGGWREVGGCGRQQFPERGESGDPYRRSRRRRGGAPLPYAMRSLGYPRRGRTGGKAEVIALGLRGYGRRFSGGWRRRCTPGFRGRSRTRSMSRRRGTVRST